ncbi:MAG TPA: hypothetical protein VK155_15470 [Bacteroidales bacterium]|nr:hypothetical protein [Bacteroidales bacterium]
MNRILISFLAIVLSAGCSHKKDTKVRIPVAEVGKTVLYYDEIPDFHFSTKEDSVTGVQHYINGWAKRKLLLMKAEENLPQSAKDEVDNQLLETRADLLIHQYQQQMMLEKMDTVITDPELESYYSTNEKAFILNSDIVKAIFIKVPVGTPQMDRVRTLARSESQPDMQQLETFCFQFAEKFDDFNEEWVTLDRLAVELPREIDDKTDFLKRNSFFETSDSASVYLVSIRDYRLRSSLAPFEYVKDDIRRIIWNTRRIQLIESLENGIYNDAVKDNRFKIY